MKWLKSSTQKTYQFDGKVIPQCVTKNNEFLAVTDEQYNVMLKNNVIKSLVNAGSIFVTDKEPSSPTQQVSNLTTQNAELLRRNTELEQKLKSLGDGKELNEVKAQLAAANSSKAAVEKELAELKKTYLALKASTSNDQKKDK